MDCDEIKNFLGPYVDGELDLVRTVEMERHLRECRACGRLHDKLQAVRSTISATSLAYAPPAGLEDRIRLALRGAGAPPSAAPLRIDRAMTPPATPPITRRWAIAASLLAGAGLFALLSHFLMPKLSKSSDQDLLADEVLASHVRSLMATHLVDIASSEHHTVKPWFDGKLDFSPPVPEVGNDFPLAGGRLDYLGGRPVAALVYGRAKHLINVFIWPTATADTAPDARAEHGYNLIHWSERGMTFWAVSDLNETELRGFVQRFPRGAVSSTKP